MTTNDQITVSEAITMEISPSLYQSDLGITEGSLYRLFFNSTITTGVLEVYQGSQLIYSSAIVFLGGASKIYESITVSERISIGFTTTWTDIIYDEVTITEDIELTIS